MKKQVYHYCNMACKACTRHPSRCFPFEKSQKFHFPIFFCIFCSFDRFRLFFTTCWMFFSERGSYLGSPCDFTCSPKLHHVFCNPVSGTCDCESKYPVKLNPATGCGKRNQSKTIAFPNNNVLFSSEKTWRTMLLPRKLRVFGPVLVVRPSAPQRNLPMQSRVSLSLTFAA